jgi:hypothetical protein
LLPDDDRTRGPLSSHDAALTDEIPGGELLTLEGAGHGIDPADWDIVTRAILDHTRVSAPRR